MSRVMVRRSLTRRVPGLLRSTALLCVLAVLATLAAVTPSAAQDPNSGSNGSGPSATAPDDDADRALEETLEQAPESVPPSPDDAFPAVTDARVALDAAALSRLRANEADTTAARKAADAATALEQARRREATAQAETKAAKAQLDQERKLLSDLTVRAYVTGEDLSTSEYRALLRGDTTDPDRGRTIMFEQVLDRQEHVAAQATRDAQAARKALAAERKLVGDRRAEASMAQLAAATRARELHDAVAAHEAAAAGLVQAIGELRSGGIGTGVPEGVAIIGLPRLSAEDLAGWFATTSYQPRVSTPITDYARWFIAEGNAEGIRGDIAFAQAVLETGGFANNDSVAANNFSGIGHCDLCPSGWTFATPELGVRAQIQLLKSYAVRTPSYASPLVDKRLRGPAGCCATWGDLTTVWATDPGYGPKVMLIYSSMVSYALQRRAAGQGLDDPIPTAD